MSKLHRLISEYKVNEENHFLSPIELMELKIAICEEWCENSRYSYDKAIFTDIRSIEQIINRKS